MHACDREAVLSAEALCAAFWADPEGAGVRYREKIVTVEGIVIRIGPDVTGRIVVQLSDRPGGRCLVLLWDAGQSPWISVGARIVCRGTVLFFRSALGVVLKGCEILDIVE